MMRRVATIAPGMYRLPHRLVFGGNAKQLSTKSVASADVDEFLREEKKRQQQQPLQRNLSMNANIIDDVDGSWSAQQRVMVDRVLYAPVASTENEIRADLSIAHKLMARYGFDDLVWNHISARCLCEVGSGEIDCCDLPTDTFLITPGGMHFSEIGPDDLVFDTIEESGNVIHSGIYSRRGDVRCVIHAHTPSIMTVSCLEEGFKFLTQDSAPFFNKIGYHDWEGLHSCEIEKDRIAASLGKDGIALIMRNHGATVVGRSIQEAWVRMYYLDRCCKVQVDAMKTGGKIRECDEEMLLHAASQIEQFFPHGKFEWLGISKLVK